MENKSLNVLKNVKTKYVREMPRLNNKELINSISKLLLEHIADANSHIAPDTRLGEDLHLIGDDAAEFLACFSKQW